MSSNKRPASYDSSDDEGDLEQSRAKKLLKNEQCDSDAILALELQKQENPTSHTPKVTDLQDDDETKHDNDAMKNESSNDDDRDTDICLQEVDFQATYALCCSKCTCSDSKIARFFGVLNNCGNSATAKGGYGNTLLYHRGCCHNMKLGCDDDYLSPMQTAMLSGAQHTKAKAKPLSHIQKKYNQARVNETKFHNLEYSPAADSLLLTNDDYVENMKKFQERKSTLKNPLTVLDLFCGIGSGTVILKKLKIPLKKVVHVEHDPTAVKVSQFNHPQSDEIKYGLKHVHIESFEEIYGEEDEGDYEKISKLIDEHGPFDLVLSAAPCQNYSQVNAYADKSKYNAQYLLKAGRLIKVINTIQKKNCGRHNEVLFLSENVVFQGIDSICMSYGNSENGHGLCPIELCASDFSPCRRKRLYWTNIPLKSIDPIKDIAAHWAIPDHFLDNGYMMIEKIVASDAEKECLPIKANTFMATTVRIDDDRMIKVKKEGDQYFVHTYSVREREVMIGLPIGYVETAMKDLFNRLTIGGFIKPETQLGTRFRQRGCLDPELWHFADQCKFKVKQKVDHPLFQIEISNPKEGKKNYTYYNEEGYCKHLIGNGWSIPVVEHLLQPLQDLFESESFFQQYYGYDYNFPWEPYVSKIDHKEGDAVSEIVM